MEDRNDLASANLHRRLLGGSFMWRALATSQSAPVSEDRAQTQEEDHTQPVVEADLDVRKNGQSDQQEVGRKRRFRLKERKGQFE